MTKLIEWLCGLGIYFFIWLSAVFKQLESDVDGSQTLTTLIYYFPIITVLAFGIYSLLVVLWRVYCFNDCPEAAKELQEQILEAKRELEAKGLKF